MDVDAYLYGMTVLSSIHRVAERLPNGDGYAEISESYVCPGGEGMNAAMLLSGLGLSTALGGPNFGTETQDVLTRYARRYGIDVSGTRLDSGYPGVRDVVLVHGRYRSVLGWFGRFFSDSVQRWGEPDEQAIAAARIVAIDPYFGESSVRAAQLARRENKPYVTIDCAYDAVLHENSAATVIAREYRAQHYPSIPDDELLLRYAAHSRGLTLFTSGQEPIRYLRAGGSIASFLPFTVEVKSTLGAGDTFRAGIVYGMFRGMADAACVRFAAGLAALVCTRLPIADTVPSLAEVEAFLGAHPAS